MSRPSNEQLISDNHELRQRLAALENDASLVAELKAQLAELQKDKFEIDKDGTPRTSVKPENRKWRFEVSCPAKSVQPANGPAYVLPALPTIQIKTCDASEAIRQYRIHKDVIAANGGKPLDTADDQRYAKCVCLDQAEREREIARKYGVKGHKAPPQIARAEVAEREFQAAEIERLRQQGEMRKAAGLEPAVS